MSVRGWFQRLRNFLQVDIWGGKAVAKNLKIVQVFSYLAYSHIYIITNINHTGNFKRDRYLPTTTYDAGDAPNRRLRLSLPGASCKDELSPSSESRPNNRTVGSGQVYAVSV